jgi:hypothetical protein
VTRVPDQGHDPAALTEVYTGLHHLAAAAQEVAVAAVDRGDGVPTSRQRRGGEAGLRNQPGQDTAAREPEGRVRARDHGEPVVTVMRPNED